MDILLHLPLHDRQELYTYLSDNLFWNKYNKKEKIIKIKNKINTILLFDSFSGELNKFIQTLYKEDYLDFIRDLTSEVKYYKYYGDLSKLTKNEIIYIARNRILDYKKYNLQLYSKEQLINNIIILLNNHTF